jgi:hypothetical protein
VFCFTTVWRLIKQRRQSVLVEYAKRPEDDTKPKAVEADYFLIGPYPEERYQRYNRADGIHLEVLGWIKSTKEAVLVLSGLSGTGKTSLLQAFVIPKLREEQPSWKILFVRGSDDPFAEFRRRLVEPDTIWKNPPSELESLTVFEFIERAAARWRVLAIFDQFEELVTLQAGDDDKKKAITDFLCKIQASPIEGFVLLLSVRTDYLTLLERLSVPPLDQNRNWRSVPAFTHADAKRFLTVPETGLVIHPDRIRRVLTEAAAADGTRGLIRPIILNMLGRVLQRIADSPAAEKAHAHSPRGRLAWGYR